MIYTNLNSVKKRSQNWRLKKSELFFFGTKTSLTRRTPDKIILHVRTNSTPKIIADSIVNIVTQIKEDSTGTAVGISAILVRNDNNDLAAKAIQTNSILKSYCSRNRIPFLSNSNMNASHLNMRGLHLNRQINLLGFAKTISD